MWDFTISLAFVLVVFAMPVLFAIGLLLGLIAAAAIVSPLMARDPIGASAAPRFAPGGRSHIVYRSASHIAER